MMTKASTQQQSRAAASRTERTRPSVAASAGQPLPHASRAASSTGSSATRRSPTAWSLTARTDLLPSVFLLYGTGRGACLRPPSCQTTRPVTPGGRGAPRGSLVQGPAWSGGSDQAAGPEASVTVEVCDPPEESAQLIEMESPGWYLTSTCEMSSGEETDRPPIAVIVSPAPRPAFAAGEPDSAPEIDTPDMVPWLPVLPDPVDPLDPLDGSNAMPKPPNGSNVLPEPPNGSKELPEPPNGSNVLPE